ncbi:MAG: non-ribosomal peptide synthetase [Terriglobales bacterium]|jgi:amino acid adenylation domain-containing protein
MADCDRTDADDPRERTIGQLFERQVRRTPDAIAVVSGRRTLTYRELDQRSNQLARHLQRLGVGPETLVGIAVERSVEMVVGLLGILKAGGAYVPMDPGYPVQRIQLMIEDSRVSVTLATERTRSRLGGTPASVVSIDGDADAVADHPSHAVSCAATGRSLAYVIYTSGSTGKPKGVMIEHGNVANFFTGMDQVIGTEPGVWLAVTSISFDISVLELFWTLTRGFQVIIHGDEGTQSIAEEIRKYGVTHMQSTPSLARMVAIDPDGLASLERLKKLLLGGETLPPSLIRQLRQRFRGELYNMYGPTETTIWSTTFQITEESDSVPIGKPIVNTQVYVLDSGLQRVREGEAGDLYIGGDGVVRGYWQRADLTAEKFLSDPFRPGNRMYHTGDLARFRPDGNLEFLGRADFQVKLRGFRIEIGEIEAALENQAGVGQVVVVAREFRSRRQTEDKRLVAYIIRKPGTSPQAADLHRALAAIVPEYMVPSNFVFLDSFPLTANGKIDRNALPHPSTPAADSDKPPELPRTDLERIIAQAWKEALEVERVGLEENFFDLGAHSLMVAEVHMQLQQLLGRDLSLVDLFQYPTVRALVSHLKGEEAERSVSSRAERRLAARRQRK